MYIGYDVFKLSRGFINTTQFTNKTMDFDFLIKRNFLLFIQMNEIPMIICYFFNFIITLPNQYIIFEKCYIDKFTL